jgi:hypothetical protein
METICEGYREHKHNRTTVHRFAPILQYETDLPVLQNARLIARPLLSERSYFQDPLPMKVCPARLGQQDGYDRLYWRCDLLLLCPRHCVFLLSRCPACRAPIPALRPQSTTCPSCGKGDYRSTVLAPQVEEETCLRTSHSLLLSHSRENPPISYTNAVAPGTRRSCLRV